MKLKIRKVDAIIIVAMIVIAGIVFIKAGYIPNPNKPKPIYVEFIQDDVNNTLTVKSVSTDVSWDDINITGEYDASDLGEEVIPGDIIKDCIGTITIKYVPTDKDLGSWTFEEEAKPPASYTLSNERSISPQDEGPHYKKLTVGREWWYYTVVFDKNSDLAGWTLSVSFNHMARNDLFWQKPDILVVTLHSPDGKEYGGIVERERYLGIIKEPALQATSSSKGFKVTFEDSYVQGKAPDWHVHVEGDDIDSEHKIIIDLQYFAPSAPLWIHSNRLIDKSEGSIASYVFTGCNVNGKVTIDGFEYDVNGVGHHEHTWVSGLLTKLLIRGWDWCHITLDNGWNVYYSNYYLLSQVKPIKTVKINPFACVIITTDKGETITKLDDVEIEILQSDKIFPLLYVPTETRVTARSGLIQPLLKPYKINIDIDIKADNTYEHTWKRLTYVGMKTGRCTVTGTLTWFDNGERQIDLNGIGTIWNMRH